MNKRYTVKFKEWMCYLIFDRYKNNDRTAIMLHEIDTNEPIAVATVNLPQVPLNDNQVIIKDYSENEGMLLTLVMAGIISEPIAVAKSGFVECPVCNLLVEI